MRHRLFPTSVRLFEAALVTAALLMLAGETARASDDGPVLNVSRTTGETRLELSSGFVIHTTSNPVSRARLIRAPDADVLAVVWQERTPQRGDVTFYSVSLDGQSFGRVLNSTHRIRLRYAGFDPLLDAPPVSVMLAADRANRLHIVQFVTQPLEAYQAALRELGARIHAFLADDALIVNMNPETRERVAQLSFVRWVGPFHAAYKLDESILEAIESGLHDSQPRHYSIQAFGRGPAAQRAIAGRIVVLGGSVMNTTPDGFRMTVTLTRAQVLDVVRMDEVHFIDPWGPGELDMDIAREIGGANYIEDQGGFTGQGVRGEVFDSGLDLNDPEWRCRPTVHCPGGGGSHGSATYGILFAQGLNPQARGLLPDGCGIFCYYAASTQFGGSTPRLELNSEATDPNGPYRSVFQTSSVGSPRTRDYTTISAETDDYLFQVDYLSTQSMSNAPLTPDTRPQAWAKNIVGVGGVMHRNTLTRADDSAAGSVGPAPDGRVKPDLIHFYDAVFTTTGGGGYTQFGGTSAATPIVAGHFGLLYQMWHEGVFPGQGGGASVFDSRCKSTTARALLFNTAFRYDWTQGGPNANLTRMHQGWGMPDLGKLYDLRNKLVIVDETDLLTPLAVNRYTVDVANGEPEFGATLVYIDPAANPASTQQRINDLTLRVISPAGVVYWGNHGLMDGNYSTAGGSPNTLDVVENVFLENPQPGEWTVEILGDEIVADSHIETPELDADYGLVISGIVGGGCPGDLNGDGFTDLADLGILLADFDCTPPATCVGDLDGDGDTDLADLGILLADFGCGP